MNKQLNIILEPHEIEEFCIKEAYKTPKISVIVPAYNVQNFIGKCIISLIKQTLKEIEIIIIDDGSKDKTLDTITSFKDLDARIEIIEQTNQKQGAARNRGIKIAKGEYIIFVDSDDYIDNDYCETLYNIAQKYSANIVTTNILKHKKNYNKYNVLYKDIKEAVMLEDKINLCKDRTQRFFNVVNKIYKTSFIKENNIMFNEGCYFEDIMFSMKTIFLANKIVSCPNTKYHYVEHSTSTVKSQDNKAHKKQDHIAAYTELQNFAWEKNIKLPERLNYTEHYWKKPFIKTYKGVHKTKNLLFGILPINTNIKTNDKFCFPIDIVYTWVDSNDSNWRTKKVNFQKKLGLEINPNDECRYCDNEELKYSLRSIEKNAPWINKIYIVTDNQVPKWLNTNNLKVKIIDHKEIIDNEFLPTFNSNAIQFNIHKIKGLSEHFLCADDDCFIVQKVFPEDFFNTVDGYPIIRFGGRFKKMNKDEWKQMLLNTSDVLEKKFNKKAIKHLPHHNIDSYRKSDIYECQKLFDKEIKETIRQPFRNNKNIERTIYTKYACLIKHGYPKYMYKSNIFLQFINDVVQILFNKPVRDSLTMSCTYKNKMKKLNKIKPKFLCINDGEHTTDIDRKKCKEFLQILFPEESSFETNNKSLM